MTIETHWQLQEAGFKYSVGGGGAAGGKTPRGEGGRFGNGGKGDVDAAGRVGHGIAVHAGTGGIEGEASNEEDNGIPLCLDCHTDIGHYNDQHPKGNKYRPRELRAHRDRVYALVESGALMAQVIARKMVQSPDLGDEVQRLDLTNRPRPTAEATRLLTMFLTSDDVDVPDLKLKLLSPQNQAYVIDILLSHAPDEVHAVSSLCRAATLNLLSVDYQRVIIEQLVRAVTLFGTSKTKSALLANLDAAVLFGTDDELRLALFGDLIKIIGRDQYSDVNLVVPALESHAEAVPEFLYADFVMTLLRHSRSDANQGAPAARRILTNLPDEMAVAAMPMLNRRFLLEHRREDAVCKFIKKFARLAAPKRKILLDDFLSLTDREFYDRYEPEN